MFTWNLIGEADTALAAPSVMTSAWNFVSTPRGNLILLGVGLAWLALLIWQPAFIGRILSGRRSMGELIADVDSLKGIPDRVSDHENRLSSITDQLSRVEEKLGYLNVKTEPPRVTYDVEGVKKQIIVSYLNISFGLIGAIQRSLIFSFKLHNASSFWIYPTDNTAGDLIIDAERMTAVNWQINLNPPTEIEPGKEGQLDIVFPVNQRLAELLAFMPGRSPVSFNFSEMRFEVAARNSDNQRQVLGYLTVGESHQVTVGDHMTFQRIRAFVNWRKNLGEDERLSN